MRRHPTRATHGVEIASREAVASKVLLRGVMSDLWILALTIGSFVAAMAFAQLCDAL